LSSLYWFYFRKTKIVVVEIPEIVAEVDPAYSM
jgi:hypothetical protein